MSRRRRLLGVVLLSGAVAACSREATPETSAVTGTEIGSRVPLYTATSMAGDSVSLASLRGKVVLLNVWATWCAPCRREIPELIALQSAYKGRGLELVGVSIDTDGTEDLIRQFAKEFQMDYAIWRDPHERVTATFRTVGVPSTFLIDRAGIIRWKHTGPVPANDTSLVSAIERSLKP